MAHFLSALYFFALDFFLFGSFDFWFDFLLLLFVSSKEKNVEWQNLVEGIRVLWHSIASNLTDKYWRLCVEMCARAFVCGGIIVLAFARNLMFWQCREKKRKHNQTYSIEIEWKRFSLLFLCRLASVCHVTCVISCLYSLVLNMHAIKIKWNDPKYHILSFTRTIAPLIMPIFQC